MSPHDHVKLGSHIAEHTNVRFCSCDLDLDLMTLIYVRDLNILTVYLQTTNELFRSRFSKVRALNTHTHADVTENITTLH